MFTMYGKDKVVNKMKKLSLVIPCYNEEKNIKLFFNSCENELKNIDIEYIFINDGSSDNTLKEIKDLIEKNSKKNIVCLNFSRNFGKESAMLAGMNYSTGDYVAIIDADLQQNPKYVKEMLQFIEMNPHYDCVTCYQEKRKESGIMKCLKKMFYKLINKLSDISFRENASDFRLMNRKMVNSVIDMKEYYRFSKGIFSYVGFNVYYMPYKVEERKNGKTSWSYWKLFKYAIGGIISFSLIPLRLVTLVGFLSFVISIIYFIVIVIQKFTVGIDISGYPTIVCLILFYGSLQTIFLGIIAEYIGKALMEIKKRPKYIIRDKIDKNNCTDI